ncbi:MAG TPA: 2'-5' RNA ligase family protein, partial [Thermoplasmata archaeon]
MRAFVSVDLPPSEPPDPSVPPRAAPAHFTLVFLGEVPDERVPSFAETLRRNVRAVAPFSLSFGAMGAFPSPERP